MTSEVARPRDRGSRNERGGVVAHAFTVLSSAANHARLRSSECVPGLLPLEKDVVAKKSETKTT